MQSTEVNCLQLIINAYGVSVGAGVGVDCTNSYITIRCFQLNIA